MSVRAAVLLLCTVLCVAACDADPRPDQVADDRGAGAPLASSTDQWRVTIVRAAPWAPDARPSPASVGSTMRLAPGAFRGPGVLACDDATVEETHTPPAGLFQGSLPTPAEPAARELGFAEGEVPGLRVTCAAGVFDLHAPDSLTLLLGLDGQIWTLSRSIGAQAPDSAPEGVVQRLLESHFQGLLQFTPQAVSRVAPYLTQSLQQAIADYFRQPWPADEVPPVDGDLFTDTQELPRRFAVGRATHHAERAVVPVTVSDGWVSYTLHYQLVREAGAWRVDDVQSRDGHSARPLLAESPSRDRW